MANSTGGIKSATKTAQAHSQDDVLKLLVNKRMPLLFRKSDVNSDVVIGFIGERGSGKSVSAGTLGAYDYMIPGENCWGNMDVSYDVVVDDNYAMRYGIPGGIVSYESNPVDIPKLLKGDATYQKGCVIVDEINIAIADARRAMANQNLLADDLIQQLRKMECAFIYSCIHEMFVDLRIRDNTDIFILCKDAKFQPANWGQKLKQGALTEWHIYAMTEKGKYIIEEETDLDGYAGMWLFESKEYWGIIDTNLKQQRKKYGIAIDNAEGSIVSEGLVGIDQSTATIEYHSKWGWLVDAMVQLHKDGIKEVPNEKLWKYLNLEQRGIDPAPVGRELNRMGIKKKVRRSGIFYLIDQYDIEKGKQIKKELVYA